MNQTTSTIAFDVTLAGGSRERIDARRGSSPRFGGFALSFLFHVGRAAMHHLAVVPVAAFMRTKN
jgi:hypothetical protein